MAKRKFPKPNISTIAAAVGGSRGGGGNTGLNISGSSIDPYHNFVKGCFIYAGDIDRLGMSFKSFKEPLRISLNEVIVPAIQKNFESQGRPSWKALKKSTIKDRLYKGYPRGPILERSGRLKKAATRKNIWEITSLTVGGPGDTLRIRTNYFDQLVPYGKYHQLGTSYSTRMRSRGNLWMKIHGEKSTGITHSSRLESETVSVMPARSFFTITSGEEAEIYNIFIAFMVERVNKHWDAESEGL